MTKKEAIERLKLLIELTSNEKFSEALAMAIEALNPWKKLSEEKPKKNGWYWVYDTSRFRDSNVCQAHWSGDHFWRNMIEPSSITHWCEISGPEEE